MLATSLLSAFVAMGGNTAHAEWRGFLGASHTNGGDSMYTAIRVLTNSSGDEQLRLTERVKAGGQFQFTGGVEWQPEGSRWSVQTSLSYHTDSVEETFMQSRFHRVPVEVLGLYQASEGLRVGLGLRKALSPNFSTTTRSGTGDIHDAELSATLGRIVQVDYQVGRIGRVFLRRVVEDYDATFTFQNQAYAGTFKGDHYGAGFIVLF